MLGTHYSCLSQVLVNDAKTALEQENPSNQGNISKTNSYEYIKLKIMQLDISKYSIRIIFRKW